MKKFYFKNNKIRSLTFSFLALLLSGFSSFANAQSPAPYSKDILVTLGGISCSGSNTQAYIGLTDMANPSNPEIIHCQLPNGVTPNFYDVFVEYNAYDNFIYLAKRSPLGATGSNIKTDIWRFDVGLASQTFSCPTLSSTPDITYNGVRLENFVIDNSGAAYSLGKWSTFSTVCKYSFFV